MRAIRVHEYGPPQVLRTEETEPPHPAAGQVAIAVEAAGVLYGDTIVRSGRYPMTLPYTPGIEVGGRVTETGPDTDPALTGRQVVATTLGNTGGYAQHALAETANVHPIPDGLPLEKAIPVFQAGAVAIGMLSAMRLQPGETVLITAAAGRIGSLLVQLAKAAGAHVIAAASDPDKLAATTADITVTYDDPDWPDHIKKATGGHGADLVLDAIGGTIGEQALQAVTDTGRVGIYGFASGTWTPLDARQITQRGLTVTGPLGIVFAKPPAEQRADTQQALDATHSGDLTPRLHAVYPLEQAHRAHTDLEQRRNTGAILLTP